MSFKLPEQKVVSVSLPQTLLNSIDQRAASLSLSRSSYLGLLAQQDLTKATPLTAPEATATAPARRLDLTAEAYAFLIQAIPALEDYARQRDNPAPAEPIPAPPEAVADSDLWQFFLLERDEILRHKYLRSKELGYDIGLSQAIQEWLRNHYALWAAAHPAR